MLRKVLTGTGIAAALTGMLLLGSLAVVPVFAATPPTQPSHQSVVYTGPGGEAEGVEGVEGVEQANEQAQEANLPGGGHQDTPGANVDHQFDGIE